MYIGLSLKCAMASTLLITAVPAQVSPSKLIVGDAFRNWVISLRIACHAAWEKEPSMEWEEPEPIKPTGQKIVGQTVCEHE